MHSLLRFVQTTAQALHSTTGNGGEQVGGQGEIERTMQLIRNQIGRNFLHRLNRFPKQQHVTPMGIHPLP